MPVPTGASATVNVTVSPGSKPVPVSVLVAPGATSVGSAVREVSQPTASAVERTVAEARFT